ncbi:MAG TPA: hypothetical protein VK999_05190 [Methylotenera sp.]|nr:hypothetical protein [Methylotenera sp.]
MFTADDHKRRYSDTDSARADPFRVSEGGHHIRLERMWTAQQVRQM